MHRCPALVRPRAARPATAATSVSSPYRDAARTNSRRLSTFSGENCIAQCLNDNPLKIPGDSKSRYMGFAKYRPYFVLSMAEFVR